MEITSNYKKISKHDSYSIIFLTSFIAICLEGFFFRPLAYGINFIDIRIFYFVTIANLLCFPQLFPLNFFRNHLIIIFYVLTFPLLFAIYNGVIFKYLSQLVPILFFSFYYSALLFNYNLHFPDSLTKLLITFTKVFSFIQLIPLLIYFTYPIHGIDIFLVGDNDANRFSGTFSEPMNLAVIAVPALLIALNSKFKWKFVCIVICFLSLILSFSIVGFLGLFLALFIMPKKNTFRLLMLLTILPVFVILIITTPYAFKINDLFLSLVQLSLLDSQNPSVFGLLSNIYVCIEVLKENLLFGGGLGSHESNYYKYILPLNNTNNPYWDDFIGIAAVDGNSLLVRITSDFGLIGFLAVITFLAVNYRKDWISKICLIYFALILARTGHYFKAEFFFFIFIYIINATKFMGSSIAKKVDNTAIK